MARTVGVAVLAAMLLAGPDDLAVGVPGEDVGSAADAGAVISLCGSEGLMSGCPDGVLTQDNPETGDAYGRR